MASARISIGSTFDPKGLNKAESGFEKFTGNASRAFGGLFDVVQKVAIAAAGIGVATGVGAIKAINSASDLSEEISKTEQIFGSASDAVIDFSKTAASTFGQSQQQALEAANTFATFGKAAGLTGEDLDYFATDFVGLASDLASFNNTSPQEAIDAIGAALRGESEPLRKYGVLLDDATLRAQALEMGIYDGNGALTAQQKIMAAEQVIYKQTRDAQGDFARTSDGLANSQRILKAEFANVVAQIGNKLLPIALTFMQFVSQKLLPVIQTLADAFSEGGLAGVFDLVWANVKKYAPLIVDAIIGFVEMAADWIWNVGIPKLIDLMQQAGAALVKWIEPRIKPMLAMLGEFIASAANWVIDKGLPMLVDKLIILGNALVDWIKPKIVPVLTALGELLLNILDWVIKEALPKLTVQLLKLANAMVGWIIDIIPEVVKALGSLLVSIAQWIVLDGLPAFLSYGKDMGKGMIDGLWNAVSSFASMLFNLGKDIVSKIVDGIKSAAGAIGSAILGAIPGGGIIGDAIGGIGGLLGFQQGGLIPGPVNMPMPIMAHGGEYVLSADIVDAIRRGAPSRGLDAGALPPISQSMQSGPAVVIENYTSVERSDDEMLIGMLEFAVRGGRL